MDYRKEGGTERSQGNTTRGLVHRRMQGMFDFDAGGSCLGLLRALAADSYQCRSLGKGHSNLALIFLQNWLLHNIQILYTSIKWLRMYKIPNFSYLGRTWWFEIHVRASNGGTLIHANLARLSQNYLATDWGNLRQQGWTGFALAQSQPFATIRSPSTFHANGSESTQQQMMWYYDQSAHHWHSMRVIPSKTTHSKSRLSQECHSS